MLEHAMDTKQVADPTTEGYAKAMDEVIQDNCRMKDIYEPTTDVLVDQMLTLTFRACCEPDNNPDNFSVLSKFMRVTVEKTSPDNGRRLTLSVYNRLSPEMSRMSLVPFGFARVCKDIGGPDCGVENHTSFTEFGWHEVGFDVHMRSDFAHLGKVFYQAMIRFAPTGVQIRGLDNGDQKSLTIESWSPDVGLYVGPEASEAASSLVKPPGMKLS